MAKFLNPEDLNKILKEKRKPQYFFQRTRKTDREEFADFYENDDSVIITFTTNIAEIEPNKEDLIGRIWEPNLKDKDGNPKIDKFTGKVMEAWSKFEAKCVINDTEIVYGFGSDWASLLRGVANEMLKNDIKDLTGTRWKIRCIDINKYNWDIEYIGKGDKPAPKPTKEDKKDDSTYDKAVEAIKRMAQRNKAKILAGLDEDEFAPAIGLMIEVDPKEIQKMIPQLIENDVISVEEDKIYIQ